MTKQEFIDKVADEAGLTRRDAQKAVDAVLDTITGTLKSGGEINFTGFGKFSTSNRAARQGVNPRTGERVQIAATTVPKFSAGSALKGAVKGSSNGGGGGGGGSDDGGGSEGGGGSGGGF